MNLARSYVAKINISFCNQIALHIGFSFYLQNIYDGQNWHARDGFRTIFLGRVPNYFSGTVNVALSIRILICKYRLMNKFWEKSLDNMNVDDEVYQFWYKGTLFHLRLAANQI